MRIRLCRSAPFPTFTYSTDRTSVRNSGLPAPEMRADPSGATGYLGACEGLVSTACRGPTFALFGAPDACSGTWAMRETYVVDSPRSRSHRVPGAGDALS